MRISRLDYDKPHRCPRRTGPAFRYSRETYCETGFIRDIYNGFYPRTWRWRFARCDSCDVVTLPYVTRWLDPTWVWYWLGCVPGKLSWWANVEWGEGTRRTWPHTCNQNRCWMHVSEPWCDSDSRWCRLARRLGR